jgi:hypothetical protein
LQPEGSLLASNDDINLTTTDSQISEVNLPVSGVYTLIATRYQGAEGASTGEFTLTITGVAAAPEGGEPAAGPTAGPGSVAYGTQISGSIDDQVLEQRYTFTGSRGDVVTITMWATNGDLDCYLSLLNAQGSELAFNDDDLDNRGRDAAIRRFTLPADGSYTIIATRYGVFYGRTSGSYELFLNRETATPLS